MRLLLFLAATELVCGVVRATVSNERFAQDFLAKSRMVRDVKDVIVGHSSVHIQNELSILDPINLWLRDRVFIRLQEYNFVRLDYPTTGSINRRIVAGLKGFVFTQRMQDGLGVKIESRCVTAVGDVQPHKEIGFWFKVRRIGTRYTYPGTLVDAQSVVHFTPLESSERRICDEDSKTKGFQYKRSLVYPISLCVARYLTLVGSWLCVGLCQRWYEGLLGLAGMCIGFSMAVFDGIVCVDRIYGVF